MPSQVLPNWKCLKLETIGMPCKRLEALPLLTDSAKRVEPRPNTSFQLTLRVPDSDGVDARA